MNHSDSTIRVIRGHGDGTFDAAVSYPVARGSSALAIGDVTGDDRPDILVASSMTGELTIFENKPGATFETAATMPLGDKPLGIVLADLDGDGRAELVVADSRIEISVRNAFCEYVERPTDEREGHVLRGRPPSKVLATSRRVRR